jgi:hypothetical protein
MNPKKTILLIAFVMSLSACGSQNNQIELDPITEQASVEPTTPNEPVKKGKTLPFIKTWEEITHENYWNNPEIFKNTEYNFADVNFSIPLRWEFNCCEDMDHGSVHEIKAVKESYGLSKEYTGIQTPLITILDYSLFGCPIETPDCSIDQVVSQTSEEKYNEIINKASKSPAFQKETPIPLSLVNTHGIAGTGNAFGYSDENKNGALEKSYIFKTRTDVLKVSFVFPNLLEEGFVEAFMGKIRSK